MARLVVPTVAGVELEVIGPRTRPYDLEAWRAEVAAPASARPQVLATDDGWPVALHEGATAVVAVYEMLSMVTAVVARGPELQAQAAAVRAALLAARPDWRGEEIVALGELWEPEPGPEPGPGPGDEP